MDSTRRNLLAGIAAAPLAACSAAPAVAAPAPARISPSMTAAIARHHAATAALDRFYRDAHNPAVDLEYARRAAIPHVEMDGSLAGDGSRVWSTADRMDVAEAHGIASIAARHQSSKPQWTDKRRRARSFYAAYLRRERAMARIRRDCGLDTLERREEALGEALTASRRAILAHPIASLADLSAKLDFIANDDGIDGDDLLAIMERDVAALRSRGVTA